MMLVGAFYTGWTLAILGGLVLAAIVAGAVLGGVLGSRKSHSNRYVRHQNTYTLQRGFGVALYVNMSDQLLYNK